MPQPDTDPRHRPSNEVGKHVETNARPNTTDAVEEAIDEGGPGVSPFPSSDKNEVESNNPQP